MVLALAPRTGQRARWTCACDCGNTTVVASAELRKASTVSCGCYRLSIGRRNARDLAGQRYGRLTVVGRSGVSGHRGVRWSCDCECGAKHVALATDLLGGRVISCGCAVMDKPGIAPLALTARRAAGRHRRRALKRNAGGVFTAGQIEAIYRAQRGRCACCSEKLNGRFHRDHRTALANGGTNDIGNIELLCGQCNLRKGAKDEIAWANENGRLL